MRILASIFCLLTLTLLQPLSGYTPVKPLRYNLNDSGTQFFQVTFLNQTWLRYNQANPGSTVDNIEQKETFDIGLRRTRIQMFGQLSDKVFVYFQFGQNNFNSVYNSVPAGNRKQAAFFHDAVGEYKLSKNNALKLGAGLTINNGLSRFSQPSIGTIMTMDVPVFAQSTVDQTDQFSRKLSVYARGQLGQMDYRFSITDPFPVQSNGQGTPKPGIYSGFSANGRHKQYQAYLMWQFFEHEPHLTPYMTGTYLGQKKIFNVSVGSIYQKNAMWNRPSINDSIQYEDMLLICAETFLDMPVNKLKGNAISAYAGYFITNYGKNYLRYNGLMNPMNGTTLNGSNSLSGQGPVYGNAHPMFGSGQILYTQFGYLLPKKFIKSGQIMPYASLTHARYDRLGNLSMDIYNAGINWLIHGHNAKISLDWQNRPTYSLDTDGQVEKGTRKHTFIIQYQISI